MSLHVAIIGYGDGLSNFLLIHYRFKFIVIRKLLVVDGRDDIIGSQTGFVT